MRIHLSLIIFILQCVFFVHAREVDTLEDQIRLEGWGEYQKRKQDFEKERLTDKDDIKKSRQEWTESQKKALIEYRQEKSKQAVRMDESVSPEYKENIQSRLAWLNTLEKSRREFVTEKMKRRREQRKHITLSEEVELGLVPEGERAPWEKRDALAKKFAGSSLGGGPSFGGGGSGYSAPMAAPPPPPLPPPSEFYEPEIPPPPPPPEFYDQDIPPPPPLFEGEEGGGY